MNTQPKEITGSVQIKNNKWYMVINAYVDGKRKIKWKSTGLEVRGNKKKANQLLAKELEKYNNYDILPNDILFCEYLKYWLTKIDPDTNADSNIELTTYASHESTINIHLHPYFKSKNIKMQDLKPEDIARYYKEKSNGWSGRRVLSQSSLARHHAIIRCALQYAIQDYGEQKIIHYNVADSVKKPKQEKKTPSFYSLDEMNALIEILRKNNHKLLLPTMLAAYYGLRREEISGLKWEAIDFKNKIVTIQHTVATVFMYDKEEKRNKTRHIQKDKTKNISSMRSFPLIEDIEKALLLEKEKQRAMILYFGNTYNCDYDDYVCRHENGNLMTPDYLTHKFLKTLRKYELKEISFHKLRHSCASLLLKMGFGMKEIQEWLGHSDIKITSEYYAHLDINSKINMSNSINEAFGANKNQDTHSTEPPQSLCKF